MKKITLLLVVFFAMVGVLSAGQGVVNMANGIKVGEVDSNSAIVWTRLTVHSERNLLGVPFPMKRKSEGYIYNLEEMESSVIGTPGQIRFTYWPVEVKNQNMQTTIIQLEQKKSTAWQSVLEDKDFTFQTKLENLLPNTKYFIVAKGRPGRDSKSTCMVGGSFKTAALPEVAAPVKFTVVTGQMYKRRDDPMNGHKIYPLMQSLEPDFFVHTGDIVYYDKSGPFSRNQKLARLRWNRMFALPFQRSFHNNVSSYFIKDDHDTVRNDCWPEQNYGDLTWEQGLATFREQVPMGEKTYRTIRWGKDLQIWLVEGRDFRSNNRIPDGPDKTIWGKEQKQWFFDTVSKSDATFRVLLSPTPIVGPDRDESTGGLKSDNHANAVFKHEGDELRRFIGKQKNMFVICGDRHWQYVSVDPKTGVREYSCGPTSDVHAAGFSQEFRTSMHKYLKIKGGFLSVSVDRPEGVPMITFRHHGVEGDVFNEDVIGVK